MVAHGSLEGPANDRTTASSCDGTGGSTLSPTSPLEETSTILISWPTGGCFASGLAVSPLDTSSSDQAGEPCGPPTGEVGSSVSHPSSTIASAGGIARVTSDLATTAILATGWEGTTPGGEGPPPLACSPRHSSWLNVGWVSTPPAWELGRCSTLAVSGHY